MRRIAYLFSLLMTFVFSHYQSAVSQITSSPYSTFGLGSIEGRSIGVSKAMGGTGIAFFSDKSLNLINPASYSGLDSLFSVFEIGLFGEYNDFSTVKEQQSSVNVNFQYLAMGFRISRRLATSFGLSPYSSVGYNISSNTCVEGSDQDYNIKYSGEGGVNRVYIGSSYSISNLSIGINVSYLFGSITHIESSDYFSYYLKNTAYVSNFNISYGIIYKLKHNKWNYNFGLIYENTWPSNKKNESTITTNNEINIFDSYITKLKIPQNFGVGVAFQKEFLKFGIDYEISKWKGIDFQNPLIKSINSRRTSLGIEFPSSGLRKGTPRMILYRIGAECRESYYCINSTPVIYRALTFGAGIPTKGLLSVINFSIELGQNGTKKNGLIKESFCTLHIDLSFKDLWFIKSKYM